MNIDDIKRSLGREFSDSQVQKLIAHLGLSPKRPKVKRGESDVGLESIDLGVDINFTRVEDVNVPDRAALPEGALVLTAVFFHSEDVQGHKGFRGALPHGLRFDTSREAVRNLLGAPAWTSPAMPIDRWQFEGYRLVVDFADDGSSVDTVTLQLPDE